MNGDSEVKTESEDRERDFEDLKIAYKNSIGAAKRWKGIGDYDTLLKKLDDFNIQLDQYKKKYNPIGFYLTGIYPDEELCER